MPVPRLPMQSLMMLAVWLGGSVGRVWAAPAGDLTLAPLAGSVQAEMALLLATKTTLTGAERKLDSRLRWALAAARGDRRLLALPSFRRWQPSATTIIALEVKLQRPEDRAAVRGWLEQLPGVSVQSAVADEIRLTLPLASTLQIAERPEVRRVQRRMPARTTRATALPTSASGSAAKALNVSQGRLAHGVDLARSSYGLTGLGQKICVLSDSIDQLGNVQASGDLPPTLDVLPGQSGRGNGFTGEGTAMLEIVHDLAPDAELGFASAFNGVASFAQNIRDLRWVAACDVIVDDIFYFDESPFQDGPIAQAVNEVTAAGADYFSSAGNEGSVLKGTAGVYQGDFVDGGSLAALPGVSVNWFSTALGSSNQVRVTASGFAASLFWTDPLGASANDYDLFVLSPDLLHILDASTDVQDGNDDPFELTGPINPEDRIVIVKAASAAPRHLHLNGLRGQFNLATVGQTKGHSAALAAFSVAAVNVASAGGGAFIGGATNPVEPFSSDGPRRLFYNADGSLANPDKPSLLGDGGVLRAKPDLAAADGVVTATPGFAQFFGTSAAAPHAAAIAALLRQSNPGLSAVALRQALLSSALDIEAAGPDDNSGSGIVIADRALIAIAAVPVARLSVAGLNVVDIDGDGDGVIEPGETIDIDISLHNDGAAAAQQIQALLTSTSVGVSVVRAAVSYPDLAAGSVAFGQQRFRLRVEPSLACGRTINLQLALTLLGGSPLPGPLSLTLPTLLVGSLGPPLTSAWVGPIALIPDNDPVGVTIDQNLALAGTVGVLSVRFDGAACSADPAATGVGLQHTFLGDLEISLRSPSGSSVRLLQRPLADFGDNAGNHLCQTLLEDTASAPIQEAADQLEPYTGNYHPAEALQAFAGEPAAGLWQMQIVDHAPGDLGVLRAFSLILRPALCDPYAPNLLLADGFE